MRDAPPLHVKPSQAKHAQRGASMLSRGMSISHRPLISHLGLGVLEGFLEQRLADPVGRPGLAPVRRQRRVDVQDGVPHLAFSQICLR